MSCKNGIVGRRVRWIEYIYSPGAAKLTEWPHEGEVLAVLCGTSGSDGDVEPSIVMLVADDEGKLHEAPVFSAWLQNPDGTWPEGAPEGEE